MQLGALVLRNGLFVAPMAGVTDRPFRTLCRRFGAGLAVSEMVSARPDLRGSRKSRLRREHGGESGPVSVQIAGADPAQMADAARLIEQPHAQKLLVVESLIAASLLRRRALQRQGEHEQDQTRGDA